MPRAAHLSCVLLIAARMSLTKDPEELGSMVSCALILAPLVAGSRRSELWSERRLVNVAAESDREVNGARRGARRLIWFKPWLLAQRSARRDGSDTACSESPTRTDIIPCIVRSLRTRASISPRPVVEVRSQIGTEL